MNKIVGKVTSSGLKLRVVTDSFEFEIDEKAVKVLGDLKIAQLPKFLANVRMHSVFARSLERYFDLWSNHEKAKVLVTIDKLNQIHMEDIEK